MQCCTRAYTQVCCFPDDDMLELSGFATGRFGRYGCEPSGAIGPQIRRLVSLRRQSCEACLLWAREVDDAAGET